MLPKIDLALCIFETAQKFVAHNGYSQEVIWQRSLDFKKFTESEFLREAAWVILCSGFREGTVRKVFDHISLSFFDWESAQSISESKDLCVASALSSFGNKPKLNAIVEIATTINDDGFDVVKKRISAAPLQVLRAFPYIGPITVFHLAKNLGLDVVKADRHLVRISSSLGFDDADHFCDEISKATGERKNVVDIIVWRYLADNPKIVKEL